MTIILDKDVAVPSVFEECEVHIINLDLVHSLESLAEDKALAIYSVMVDNDADLVIVQDMKIAKRLKEEGIFVYVEG